MIRNTMIGLSLFAFLAGSALAATPAAHKHTAKVAAAPAGDTAKEPAKADAPKDDAAKTDAPKKDKKVKKAPKGDAKPEGGKEMKAPAPAPETK